MPKTQAGSRRDAQMGVVVDSSGRPRYTLERLLDEGGSEGRIFLATDAETHDVVALKQFTSDLGANVSGRDLGVRLRTLRGVSLQLRNVRGLVGYLDPFEGEVRGVDWGRSGWWLPMEFVSGESLATVLRRGVDARTRQRLLDGLGMIATTLEQLAELQPPVAHRDVKPANIMVRTRSDGALECILVDIGLMARADRQHFSTVGSNGYMAPELLDARPVPREQLHLADWYSFTALLYAVVVGTNPPSAPERWPAALSSAGVPERLAEPLISAGQAPPTMRPPPSVLIHALLAEDETQLTTLTPPTHRRWARIAGFALAAALTLGGSWAYATGTIGTASGSVPSSALNGPTTAPSEPVTGTATDVVKATKSADGYGQHRIGVSSVLCLAMSTGLRCAGNNESGMLGEGSTTDRPGLVTPMGFGSAKSVAVGTGQVCAVADDATLWCWGGAGAGSNPGASQNARPNVVAGLTDVTAVEVHDNGACAISSGSVWCWGSNSWGEVGNGQTSDRAIDKPVRIKTISDAVAVAPYCALRATGALLCWRPVGRADVLKPQLPHVVKGLPPVTAIAGTESVTCAVAGGGVYCWGSGDADRQYDTPWYSDMAPQRVTGLNEATRIAVGSTHACALASGGSIWCWGGNFGGALGNGTVTDSPTPIRVSGDLVADDIAAGGSTTCAIKDDDAWCWGSNYSGQFADGTNTARLRPVQVGVSLRNERAVSLAAIQSTAELHLDPCNNCDVPMPASMFQVELFEKALVKLGFLDPNDVLRGYGPATFKAVEEFQRSRHSAVVDGIVGPKELALIGRQSELFEAAP
ncbi:regulator of chromosome condensation (RCC1) repeat-containing protein [Humibacillus xanthopallidus]|uniref:Regulator of chromosome condensation (RCC1) repeat-containing protein n=1 Tax=Humibacillus xanthopallidus TaxID=412689 RepID=A0A543PQC9_9MICO|nr:peptidoglycan-binding protein [Humibacillus xanthopallidus]TQN46278.1 regulator of chromosome condensation (RCC1) repeat-containing protein [Humibacillus xanthopallidus]